MYDNRELMSSTVCRPVFHPTDPNVCYTYSRKWGFMVTRDRGRSWRRLTEFRFPGEVLTICVDPDRPAFMLAGTDDGVFVSGNGGVSWTRGRGASGKVIGLYVDPASPPVRRTCFAAGTEGVFRSDDGGRS